jgi:hypothetical protein
MVSKKQKLKPYSDFSDKSVRNTMVRASVFDESTGAFFTGSEEGFLCCWKSGEEWKVNVLETSTGKAKSSLKQKKSATPY